MLNAGRNLCERWLRLPPEPGPPPGDEASARIFRAAPGYFQYCLLAWAVRSVPALLFATGLLILPAILFNTAALNFPRPGAFLIIGLAGFVGLLLVLGQLFQLAVLRLDFERRWYIVTDRSLRIREGILNVREMTVTFANVQDISVSQGPLQRYFGIADLEVETAGGSGGGGDPKHPRTNLHQACFRGIANAAEVKELINARLRALKDAGLGDPDDRHHVAPAEPATYLTMNSDIATVLREVLAEARALRETVRESVSL